MFGFKSTDQERLRSIYGAATVVDVSRRALNDTGQRTRTEISKQVRNVFNVTAGKVREKSYVVRQRGNNSQVDIGYRDFRPHLGRFATSAQRNVRVKVRKKSGTKTVKGGFRIKKFGDLIWKRLTPKEAQSSKYRGRKTKIKVLRTIAIPEMVRATSNARGLQLVIQDTFDRRFDHHFKRKLGLR